MFRGQKLLFTSILILMIAVTTWASLEKNLMDGFAVVWAERWGIATLADAYCGFLTFYAWVFYKESGWASRIVWLALILVFGNIAMASYVLWQLNKLKPGDTIDKMLVRSAA